MENQDHAPLDVAIAVRERYSRGALAVQPELCCPVDYDPQHLTAIPQEVLDRDYGCGDPSRYVQPGETVLDLGSGSGKICFIASQVVGSSGRVIGIDVNPDMLALARTAAPVVAERIGHANVTFRTGHIQDLALDLTRLDAWLAAHPVRSAADVEALAAEQDRLRREEPLIPSDSIDVVVSNCVLNLVGDRDKQQLFQEIHRVLKRGGRIAISDIVADEPVSQSLKDDPELWSGCISGAFTEEGFLGALEEAGFHGITVDKYDAEPWRTVQGIEFRAVTITAWKGKEGPCWEGNHAVLYRGPFRQVTDDDGHTYRRGERVAVCVKTFEILTKAPYAGHFEPIEPLTRIRRSDWTEFDGSRPVRRHARETKGLDYDATTEDPGACCAPGAC